MRVPRSPALKRILWIVGVAVGLLILVALAAPFLVDINRSKPRLEAAASDAMGMDVRAGGRLGMGFFPGFHVTVEEGRILSAQGAVVVSAKRTRLWIRLFPLLFREFRLRRIELIEPKLSIERGPEGKLSVEILKKPEGLLVALNGGSVSLSDGTLFYADRRSGKGFEVTGVDLSLSSIRAGREPQLLRGLSFKAELRCDEVRTKEFAVSAVKVSVHAKDGVFDFQPITMDIFGGKMAGSLKVDGSGPVPVCEARCSLPSFRIEECLEGLTRERSAEGAMDFSASLSVQGTSMSQMVQTAAGEISLRGENLLLQGNDLDRRISRFESSQNFSLVDVGAVFFAGPLGLAATRGYSFSGLFHGSGGNSRIRTIVSDWTVERGVAQAKDVALATLENRIALQGQLDLVNGQFTDVTVAVIDPNGCAGVRQEIHGPFEKPVVEKPRVLTSLAGPVLKLYKTTRALLPAGPCEVFYSGSVATPRP